MANAFGLIEKTQTKNYTKMKDNLLSYFFKNKTQKFFWKNNIFENYLFLGFLNTKKVKYFSKSIFRIREIERKNRMKEWKNGGL